jgi:hypothetical protein
MKFLGISARQKAPARVLHNMPAAAGPPPSQPLHQHALMAAARAAPLHRRCGCCNTQGLEQPGCHQVLAPGLRAMTWIGHKHRVQAAAVTPEMCHLPAAP